MLRGGGLKDVLRTTAKVGAYLTPVAAAAAAAYGAHRYMHPGTTVHPWPTQLMTPVDEPISGQAESEETFRAVLQKRNPETPQPMTPEKKSFYDPKPTEQLKQENDRIYKELIGEQKAFLEGIDNWLNDPSRIKLAGARIKKPGVPIQAREEQEPIAGHASVRFTETPTYQGEFDDPNFSLAMGTKEEHTKPWPEDPRSEDAKLLDRLINGSATTEEYDPLYEPLPPGYTNYTDYEGDTDDEGNIPILPMPGLETVPNPPWERDVKGN